jgi:hypothetical protein
MRRLAVQELAKLKFADEFAAADLDFAADGDDARPAFDRPAFEC